MTGKLYRTRKISKGMRHVLKTIDRFAEMPMGQQVSFLTRNRELFSTLFKDVQFESIYQPLYTNCELVGHAVHRGIETRFR